MFPRKVEDWEPPVPPPRPPADELIRGAPETMDQNALSIYRHNPRTGTEGDVVLPRALTDGSDGLNIPQMPKAAKSDSRRRRTSMLRDTDISLEEMRGAEYFDSLRLSDKPNVIYALPPDVAAPAKGKQR